MNGNWKMAKAWRIGLVVLLSLSAPAFGADSDAATRQYNVAVGLQNREAYDLAAEAWTNFLQTYPEDSRVNHARH